MTARQRLDHVILTVTGMDIRLVGNWEPLPDLQREADLLAERLSIPKSRLLQCRDIVDVIGLMEEDLHRATPDQDPRLF